MPLCPAAHTAFLIDTDKGVRPCCAYLGEHREGSPSIGDLREQSIGEIMASDAWQEVRRQLADSEVPPGCAQCIDKHQRTGWSPLNSFVEQLSPDWEKGITFIEINSSNVCNLQCRHCSGHYSSAWVKESGYGNIFKPDRELILDSLRGLDLQYLSQVMFKGGEPMLNADCEATLRYLDEGGILERVHVAMVTNGSTIRPAMFDLLSRAKQVGITLSLDGVGDVQTYIRHGDSSNANIEEFIETFAKIEGIRIQHMTSVMAYNVFSLERLTDWWNGLRERYPTVMRQAVYNNTVIHPEYLSVRILKDDTRARLAARYRELDAELYDPVIRQLELPFAGDALRQRFVEVTLYMDRRLGMNILKTIPEFAAEFDVQVS